MNEKIIEREQNKGSNRVQQRTTGEPNLIFAGNTKYWEYANWTGLPIMQNWISVCWAQQKKNSFVMVPYKYWKKRKKIENIEKERKNRLKEMRKKIKKRNKLSK